MRLWDRLTGGAAQIEIEPEKPFYTAGEVMRLRAAVTSSSDLEAKSALVTLRGVEEIRYEVPVYQTEGDSRESFGRDRDSSWDRDRDSNWDQDRDSDSGFGAGGSSMSPDAGPGLRQVGTEEKHDSSTTVNVDERVPGPLRIPGGQPFMLEAQLQIPRDAPPTYVGTQARHTYHLTVALDVAWSTNPSQTIDVIIGVSEDSLR
ncbi:MAG: hypothetical protein KKI08_10115 [Armatimonadetes bacterium]|nr:hypothetical protein [Armatimonadota bacterium]